MGLRYLTRIRSASQNPSLDIIKDTGKSLRKFENPRSSKPFHIRLNEEVSDNSVKQQKVFEVGHQSVPPWLVPDVSCCSKDISKKNQTEEEVKAKFLEHDVVHKDHIKLYTDGSKSEEGVGCAAIHENTSYVVKLPDSASIYTAELTAVINALDRVYHSEGKDFVIYSDSKSTIESLKLFNSFHPLIQKAQEWLFRISGRHKLVHFCWIPSHVGIQGNEIADREAKEAIHSELCIIKKVPPSDMKKPIRSYVLKKWEERWLSPLLLNNKKYRNLRESISPWPSSFNSNRRTEIVLTRLRIGHSRLTHKYILEGSSPPECLYCDCRQSIEHLLVQCPRYNTLRRKHSLHNKAMRDILNDEVDVCSLMAFLKEINIFNKI